MADVTVCIPTYNAGRLLERAVASAFAQKVDVEVVVVDDGSTDGSVQGLDPRCLVLRGVRRGPAAARNLAVEAASAPVIAFLDADDWWEPAKLLRQMTSLEGGAVMSCTDRWNDGAVDTLPARQSVIQPLFCGDVFEHLLVRGNFITTSTVVLTTAAFRRAGGFSSDCVPAEDWDLWLRVLHDGELAAVEEPLTHYTHHRTSLSRADGRMNAARLVVAARALKLPRARQRGRSFASEVWGAVLRTNAWDAARRAAWRESLVAAGQATMHDPSRASLVRFLRSALRR